MTTTFEKTVISLVILFVVAVLTLVSWIYGGGVRGPVVLWSSVGGLAAVLLGLSEIGVRRMREPVWKTLLEAGDWVRVYDLYERYGHVAHPVLRRLEKEGRAERRESWEDGSRFPNVYYRAQKETR